MCTKVIGEIPDCKQICIYGELFGGTYPNSESNYKPVQSGVYYSPDLHFYAFDISYFATNTEIFIDYDISLRIFKVCDVLHAEPIATYSSKGNSV